MGNIASAARVLWRKRSREDEPTHTSDHHGEREVDALLSLRYKQGGAPVCQSVVSDGVDGTYGCHYHLYESLSPQDSHGVALVWSLPQTPDACISTLELLSLCRVANSCRKKTLLLGDASVPSLLLQYTASL